MHDILVMKRIDAIAHSYNIDIEKCIIISINDDAIAEFATFNPKIKDVCSLVFSDIYDKSETGILMTEEDAVRIKDFVLKWKEKISTIIIHCKAGISRSSAIAAVINLYLNGDDMIIWRDGKYSPNIHCYNLLLKAFNIEISNNEMKEKREINEKAFDDLQKAKENESMFI